MKIVVASNSHKELANSSEVNDWIISGLREKLSKSELINVPISDGGDGLIDFFLHHSNNSKTITARVHDPLMRLIDANYCIVNDDGENTAIIEFSEASGIKRLTSNERLIMKTSSYGVGELILDAVEKKCSKIIIGLGGAATSDAGIGACCALGMNIIDENGYVLNKYPSCSLGAELLSKITTIDATNFINKLKSIKIIFLSDVNNYLLGKNGSAHVFAPQKGASKIDVLEIESGMLNIRRIILNLTNCDVNLPFIGAAGGFAVFFKSFFDSKVFGGTDYLLKYIKFDSIIQNSDLVITGEGKLDDSTVFEKAPFGISKLCKSLKVPVSAIFGTIDCHEVMYDEYFDFIINSSLNTKVNIYDDNDRNILIPRLIKESAFLLLNAYSKSNIQRI